MPINFVDCHGFAGGFSCGATQVGMHLVGKLEGPGGFGVPLMEANRKFLGNDWESQVGKPETWDKVADVDVVIGTPPCSGFSSMTAGYKDAHGMDAPINHCMYDLIEYAAKVRPTVVAMESVGQAFSKGLPLMRTLGARLNALTGDEYSINHVMQNNLSVGGCTNRKRYFLVLSKVPFGVERHDLGGKIATVGDAFGDLVDQPLSWDPNPYADEANWWSSKLRSKDGEVDGHETVYNGYAKRIQDVTTGPDAVEWFPGESDVHVLRRYYQKHGKLPASWQYLSGPNKDRTREDYLVSRNFDVGGFSKPRMWPWDKPGRVINGAGPHMVWHPNNRFITHRETARLLGFPDDWVVGTAKETSTLYQFWGKGTSVAPARWISQWIKNSIEGNPGSYTGVELERGDRFIDISTDWKPVWAAQEKLLEEQAA